MILYFRIRSVLMNEILLVYLKAGFIIPVGILGSGAINDLMRYGNFENNTDPDEEEADEEDEEAPKKGKADVFGSLKVTNIHF